MRSTRIAIAGLVLAGLMLSGGAQGQSPDKYQVTGQVVEVTDSMIVVMKGKERFEMARDASTKVTGDIKVGSKITAKYKITATSVEVKADKAAAKPKAK
jgi:hypothetical protein